MRRWILPALLVAAIGFYASQLGAPTYAAADSSGSEATDVKPAAKPAPAPKTPAKDQATPDKSDDSAAAAGDKSADKDNAAKDAGDSTDVATEDSRWPGGQPPLIQWNGESPNWVHGQEFSAVAGAKFIGTQECLNCHKEMRDAFVQTAHARSLSDPKAALDQQGCEA